MKNLSIYIEYPNKEGDTTSSLTHRYVPEWKTGDVLVHINPILAGLTFTVESVGLLDLDSNPTFQYVLRENTSDATSFVVEAEYTNNYKLVEKC